MRINEIFNRRFYWFLGATFFAGILPIILYPFSRYFGKEEEYSGGNHGPLHQFPAGDWNGPPPQGIDWLIEKTAFMPILMMFILSLIVILFFLFTKKIKIGFSYLIPALLSFILIFCQAIILLWLFD
jgi:hypothetical protein